MDFTVQYRDRDGVLRERVLSARSRAELFKVLEADGLRPTQVREGVAKRSAGGRSAGVFKIVGAVVLAGAVVAGAVWWLKSGVSAGREPPSVKVPESTKAEASARPREAVRARQNAMKEPEKERVRSVRPEQLPAAVEPRVVETPVPPPAETNRLPEGDFKTGTEQVMRWIFTTQVGDMPPPLPALPEDEKKRIVEIILDKNPVKEGDSEKTAEAKAVVRDAKHELAQFLKGGGKVEEFMEYYHNILVDAHQKREEAQHLVYEFSKEGDDKLTVEYVKKVNKTLEKEGIRTIDVPRKVKRRLGLLDVKNKEQK